MRKYDKIVNELLKLRKDYEKANDSERKAIITKFNNTFDELYTNYDDVTALEKEDFKQMSENAASLDEAIEVEEIKKDQKKYDKKETLIFNYKYSISDEEITLKKSAIKKLRYINTKKYIIIGGLALAGVLALGLKGCNKEDVVNNNQTTTEATTEENTGYREEKTTEIGNDVSATEANSEENTQENNSNSVNNSQNSNNNVNNDNSNNNNNNTNNNNNSNNNSNNNNNNDKNNDNKNNENNSDSTTSTTEERKDIDRTTTETKKEDINVPTTEAPATATTEENKPTPKTEKDAEKITEEYPGEKVINEDNTKTPSINENSSIKDGESDEETYYYYEDIETSLNNKKINYKGKTLTLKFNC